VPGASQAHKRQPRTRNTRRAPYSSASRVTNSNPHRCFALSQTFVPDARSARPAIWPGLDRSVVRCDANASHLEPSKVASHRTRPQSRLRTETPLCSLSAWCAQWPYFEHLLGCGLVPALGRQFAHSPRRQNDLLPATLQPPVPGPVPLCPLFASFLLAFSRFSVFPCSFRFLYRGCAVFQGGLMADQVKVITASREVVGCGAQGTAPARQNRAGPTWDDGRLVTKPNSLQPKTRHDTMKNRHETPVTTPPFECNALMHSQMRTIMSSRGSWFVSNSVYFCLLLPTDPTQPG